MPAQDMQSCPMHKEHTKEATQHQADVEKHGDEAMGFPHDKTSHHFHLYSDGGAIEVTVNDSKNSQNVQAIRSHLRAMARIAWVSSSRLVHLQPRDGWPCLRPFRDIRGSASALLYEIKNHLPRLIRPKRRTVFGLKQLG